VGAHKGSNTITDQGIKTLREVTRRVLGSGKGAGGFYGEAHSPDGTWYWAKVKIGSEITAGTLEAPTEFLFDIWFPDPDSTDDPRPFIVTDNDDLKSVTGVNRSSMEAAESILIKVEYAYGEWSPKWIDCPT